MEKKKSKKVSKQGKYVKSNFVKIKNVISKIFQKENTEKEIQSWNMHKFLSFIPKFLFSK